MMKTKTLIAGTPDDIDKLLIDFDSKHKVKFTQTHYSRGTDGWSDRFVYVVFYED